MYKKSQTRLLIALVSVLVAVLAVLFPTKDNNSRNNSKNDIGRSVPAFSRTEFSSDSLASGHVSVVNFFASWCPPCEAENDALLALKKQDSVAIYGIDYKDSSSGLRDFLARLGNPYTTLTSDPEGVLGVLWGISGVPETFVIDSTGHIRYRHQEPLTPIEVNTTLLPLIRQLRSEQPNG